MSLPEDRLSFLQLLLRREIEADHEHALKISCRVAQRLILQPTSTFRPVWKKESQKHVCIGLDRRIYFDNHQQCYFNDGADGNPRLLYTLGGGSRRSSPSLKIWAVLLYHDHIRRYPCTAEEREVCLLVLTADGYLKVLNADTAVVLKSVFLSSAIDNQYRYLSWANYLYTVQVKTVQTPRPPPAARNLILDHAARFGDHPFTRLLTIAVFKILPLELLACFSVDRRIFGEDIKDASVHEDRLVVYHQKGSIFRIYSLYQIIANSTVSGAKLGERLNLDGYRSGVVGDPDFGIPVAKIKERPPLLFEARSRSDVGVSFGGVPSVYLHNGIPKDKSLFHIRSLQSSRLISKLSTNIASLHPDVAEFHFDDYQRVIHISGCTLSCYRLQLSDCRKQQELVRQYSVDFKELMKRERANSQLLKTSSGRTVKRRFSIEDEDLYTSAIQDVDYENELDLLYAVVTLHDPSREGNLEASLYFIDDKTGDLLKKVPLPTWQPDLGNSIYYELNCIIHLVQEGGSSTCHYYRLCRENSNASPSSTLDTT